MEDLTKFRYHESWVTITVRSKNELKRILCNDFGFLKIDEYGIDFVEYEHDERIGQNNFIVYLIAKGDIRILAGFSDSVPID